MVATPSTLSPKCVYRGLRVTASRRFSCRDVWVRQDTTRVDKTRHGAGRTHAGQTDAGWTKLGRNRIKGTTSQTLQLSRCLDRTRQDRHRHGRDRAGLAHAGQQVGSELSRNRIKGMTLHTLQALTDAARSIPRRIAVTGRGKHIRGGQGEMKCSKVRATGPTARGKNE